MRAWFGIAAVVALMTGRAAADSLTGRTDTWQCNVDGTVCGWVDGHKSTPPAVVMGDGWSQPSSISAIGSFGVSISPPLKTRCAPGWTLVDVGVAPGGLVHKCAPVGDLRDPE